MEFWKFAIFIRLNKKGKLADIFKTEIYLPKYFRLVMWKVEIEFRFGCVKDSLKALEIIRQRG